MKVLDLIGSYSGEKLEYQHKGCFIEFASPLMFSPINNDLTFLRLVSILFGD